MSAAAPFDDSQHPRGAAGQFRAKPAAEASGGMDAIAAAPARVPWKDRITWGEESYDESSQDETTSRTGTGAPIFNDRVRLLLGAPAGASVSVVDAETRIDVGGCGSTFEHSTEVTVTAGELERTFESLPHLWTELDYAGHEPVTDEVLLKDLARTGLATMRGAQGAAAVFAARIGNARGQTVLLIVDQAVKDWHGAKIGRRSYVPAGTQERWLYASIADMLAWQAGPPPTPMA